MCSFLHFLNTRTFKTIFLNIWMYHIHGTQIWRRIVRIVNSMHLTQSPCHFIIARNSIIYTYGNCIKLHWCQLQLAGKQCTVEYVVITVQGFRTKTILGYRACNPPLSMFMFKYCKHEVVRGPLALEARIQFSYAAWCR